MMSEELHFVVYILKHEPDIAKEVEALKLASECLAEDLRESGYDVLGVMGHGAFEPGTPSDRQTEKDNEEFLSSLDPVKQAEVIIDAHRLGEWEKTHQSEVKARGHEILDAVQESKFSAAFFDMPTQGFIGRYIHNLLKSPIPVSMTDCLWLMGIGYHLGKEGQKWLKKDTENI